MSKQKKGTAAKANPIENTDKPAPAAAEIESPNPKTNKQPKPRKTQQASWVEEGGRKPTKGRAAAKAPAPEKASKAAPPDDPREDLVVFAFRLTQAEREAIHEAAGPAKASRFVRAVALAAARRDVAAIQAVILEAQGAATA